MSSYRINPSQYSQIFALPSAVVDRYLNSASGLYLKVLLYLYRYSAGSAADEKELARKLSFNEDHVHDALVFWEKEGLILCDGSGSVPAEASAEKHAAPSDSGVRILSDRPPLLSSGEIAEHLRKDEELRFVFSQAEQLFGRPLTTTEQRSLISMREWIGLPADVVMMILEFCKSIDRMNIRYIEKVAADWSDLGITTHELAEEHISRLLEKSEHEKAVRDCFGIRGRNLTTNEKKYIDTWFTDYRFTIDIIRLAFEKTADNTGKISFKYTDKILSQWHEKGIRTVEEANSESALRKDKGERKTSYDLDALDRIGLEIPDL